MTETKIRERMADYCQTGDLKKVKAMYTMIEGEIEEASGWSKEFIKELDKRTKSFLDGSAKTYTWEETKQAAMDRVKAKKNGVSNKNS